MVIDRATAIVLVVAFVPALGCAGASVCKVERRTAWGTEVSTLTRHGRLVGVSFDDGRGGQGRTRFSYDGHGRMRWTQERFSTRGFYHPHPSPSDTAPRRYVIRTRYRYDGSERPSSIRRETKRWTSRSATGRPDQRMPPSIEVLDVTVDTDLVRMDHRVNGEPTRYAYHFSEGALASVVMPHDEHSSTRHYGYDGEARLTTVVDACSPGAKCHPRRCRFVYEQGGRVLTYACDPGQRWRFELDDAGRLGSAERGVAQSYRYDAEGRLVEIESSSELGRLERFAYEGRCPIDVVRRFAPSVTPMELVDEPPRPDVWPDELPVR